jgi:hypothetical protein
MKIAVIVLAISTMILLLAGAVQFHLETRCRQKAWAKAFEMKTHALLTTASSFDLSSLPSCKVTVIRKNEKVTWQKPLSHKPNLFYLNLRGKL